MIKVNLKAHRDKAKKGDTCFLAGNHDMAMALKLKIIPLVENQPILKMSKKLFTHHFWLLAL